MKVKKSIDIKQDTLDALNLRYPDTPFTKLVERGLETLLREAGSEDMFTKEAIVTLLNNMGKQIHDLHKRLK